jgi:acyl-coenzyme A synthetase/AMP-(fatty) acid ligase/thioesterase domain-containing protein/acyl carrier protein
VTARPGTAHSGSSADLTAAGGPDGLPELVLPGPHTGVLDRLAEVAGFLGDHDAIDAADGRLTYAELIDRIHALGAEMAPVLAGMSSVSHGGADVPRPVGVFAEQGTDSIAAMMAVMAAGHPCVVLDSQLPDARVRQIAEQAEVGLILADDTRRPIADAFPGSVVVRGLVPAGTDPRGGMPTSPPSSLDTPASLVFTSGTTGKPKGVVYTHRTVLACGYTSRIALSLTATDRVALVVPQAFAAGQIFVFGALLNVATLCVRDPRVHGIRDLAEWVQESRVTTMLCTPSLLRSLQGELGDDAVLDAMRLMITAGEKVFGKDVAAIRPHLTDHASFMNWMGSSETEALTSFEVPASAPVPDGVLPAGRVVPLRELTIRSPEGEVLPVGESGILHVTSAHMSAGYWQDPEGTARVFTELPDGQTTFRTGDRARLADDGILHLLGRADDAVKIRGNLVEPQEIETTLRSFPEVADAVVRAVPGRDEDMRLIAWVVPNPHHSSTPSPASVRSTLARLLPAYMVPSQVVMLTQVPRNERGKVAAAELPQPPARPEPVPPATPAETAMADIWTPILRLEAVGRDESFTALGGDSLAVEEMLAGVEQEFGVSLTTADLAEHASLEEFAALADAGRQGRTVTRADTLVRLHPSGTNTPVFCFAGAGGAAALFEPLTAELGPDQPVYAFQVNGFENPGMPDWTVTRAARRYVRIIEQVVPEGPVVLAGHSLGGLFALRVAQLLHDRQRDVPLLALLDTILPPAARTSDDGEGSRGRLAQLKRSVPVLVVRALGDFLQPTTLRRRRAARRDLPGPIADGGARPQRAYLRTRLRVLGAGFGKYDYSERKDIFNLHGIGIAQFHKPRPWPGRTLVFLSEENHDDPRWWDALLPGTHEFHQVGANHVAVLKLPFVTQIAEPLIAAMKDLELVGGSVRD